jgi:hypothetical protein
VAGIDTLQPLKEVGRTVRAFKGWSGSTSGGEVVNRRKCSFTGENLVADQPINSREPNTGVI